MRDSGTACAKPGEQAQRLAQHASDRLRNPTVFGRSGRQSVKYLNLSLARCDSGRAESRYSPNPADSSDARRLSIWANGTRGRVPCAILLAGDMQGAGTRAIAAPIAPTHSHQRQKWGRAGETGPCGSSFRAFARTAGPKLAKVCVLTPTLELDSQVPFRKHQVDCLRLWRLSSPWILKRILLAILSIRAGAKRARGLSRSPLDGGFG